MSAVHAILAATAACLLLSLTAVAQEGLPPERLREQVGRVDVHAWNSDGGFFHVVTPVPGAEGGIAWFVFAWNASELRPEVQARVVHATDGLELTGTTEWSSPLHPGGTSPLCHGDVTCYDIGFPFRARGPEVRDGALEVEVSVGEKEAEEPGSPEVRVVRVPVEFSWSTTQENEPARAVPGLGLAALAGAIVASVLLGRRLRSA